MSADAERRHDSILKAAGCPLESVGRLFENLHESVSLARNGVSAGLPISGSCQIPIHRFRRGQGLIRAEGWQQKRQRGLFENMSHMCGCGMKCPMAPPVHRTARLIHQGALLLPGVGDLSKQRFCIGLTAADPFQVGRGSL